VTRSDPGRLHVITDETVQRRWTHAELARQAALGGADVVQFREKRPRSEDRLRAIGTEITAALRGGACRLVVNDRVIVAAEIGAAGVHLGPDDLSPAAARRLLGPGALIGATANDPEAARRLVGAPIDYVGAGPVFGTASKRNPARALGLDGLRAIVELSSVPVIAIGNITPERVAGVLRTGAYGVAVLSDVVRAGDPAARTAEFAEALGRLATETVSP
jgi:thiamine-phosphate pyrophosphorylase